MQEDVRRRILESTGAERIGDVAVIQPLWNHYGTLSRVYLKGSEYPAVIVKHIEIPNRLSHPRGFASDISRQRKIKSYEVETHWYGNQNDALNENCPTPKCLAVFDEGGALCLLLEDLATRGYSEALYSVSLSEIEVVLRWLANFHSSFIDASGEGLWSSGTYWHLQTRPEELANIEGTQLHLVAGLLDARLRQGEFQTLVHGDAKLANFLFSSDHERVAAVDFQYVGRGCAMKDVAYFLGSCLSGNDCERLEAQLLEIYFDALGSCLPKHVDAVALEQEWRSLYPVAWADFQRFMLGWSPNHRKLTAHSDATTRRAIDGIIDELIQVAKQAAVAAGKFIHASRKRRFEVSSKGFADSASDVVTEIDIEAQRIIMEMLAPTIARFDLGVLAEEGVQDDSRLTRHAFWTIDPLDGTQYFIENQPGYATSIALVTHAGEPVLGVVYDPLNDALYESVRGRGVLCNGKQLDRGVAVASEKTKWFADRSLQDHPKFNQYRDLFEIHFDGGAVMNVLHMLTEPNSMYIKMPKNELGGCAIWDLAAVSLMVTESAGTACFFDGKPLHLNREDSVYFNDVGLAILASSVELSAVRSLF